MLRKLFGSKRDEVTGEWRRLHNEDLYGCTSLQIINWFKSDVSGTGSVPSSSKTDGDGASPRNVVFKPFNAADRPRRLC